MLKVDDEDLVCTDHPRYVGKGIPRKPCIACLVIFVDKDAGQQFCEAAAVNRWLKRHYATKEDG